MNKSALVTGASRGIGKAIAYSLAKEGYDLHLICQNNIESLNEYAEKLSHSHNIKVKTYAGNVASYNFIKDVFSQIDHLDLVVNNAGISYVGLLQDMSEEDWKNIVSVNLDSVFYVSKEATKLMLEKHCGHIINISSVWGSVGASMEVAYSTTKGGINSFTKALAKELAPSGIQVNALACGFIDTSMNAHLSEDDRAALLEEIPANRFGSPEDVAAALLSVVNGSSYMTGQVISVDGGWI